MRIQRNKGVWVNINFELKTQSTKIYKEWATEVLSVQNIADILLEESMRRAVDVSLDMFITRSYADLEVLIPC